MRTWRVFASGWIAGVIAAGALAAVGRALDVTIAPWTWAAPYGGWAGRIAEWGRTTLFLLPWVVIGAIAVAFACAATFEFITRRSGVLLGLAVGLLCGTAAAEAIGLVPWAAYWCGYSYVPALAPIGIADPTWFLFAIVGAGAVAGGMAGVLYGTPRHAPGSAATVRWREIYRAADAAPTIHNERR